MTHQTLFVTSFQTSFNLYVTKLPAKKDLKLKISYHDNDRIYLFAMNFVLLVMLSNILLIHEKINTIDKCDIKFTKKK